MEFTAKNAKGAKIFYLFAFFVPFAVFQLHRWELWQLDVHSGAVRKLTNPWPPGRGVTASPYVVCVVNTRRSARVRRG